MGTKSHIPIRHLNIGICSILAADNDDTADDAQNELQIVLHEIDLPY